MREREHAPPRLRPVGYFVLRTPVLPVAAWHSLAPDAADGREGRARRTRELTERPDIREALALSSEALRSALERSGGRRQEDDLEPVLRGYLTRMATRSVPFGLMASVSLGRIGTATTFSLADTRLRRATRHDGAVLARRLRTLVRGPLADLVPLRANETAVEIAQRITFVAPATKGRHEGGYEVAAIESGDVITEALAFAAEGVRRRDLVAHLAVQPDMDEASATELASDLVDVGLLVPDLSVDMFAREPLRAAAAALRAHAAATDAAEGDAATAIREAEAFERAARALADIDARGVGVPLDAYRAPELDIGQQASDRAVFQVDLFRDAPSLSLGGRELELVTTAARLLPTIVPRTRDAAFTRFASAFAKRFESRPVPLLYVLDEDCSVSYDGKRLGAPIVAGLRGRERTDAGLAKGGVDVRGAFAAHLHEALATGAPSIELDGRDLEALARRPVPHERAVAVSGTLLGPAGDRRLYVRSLAAGQGGLDLFARFGHLDEGLFAELRKHANELVSRDPSRLYAEIAHVPADRLGNVVMRSRLYDAVIPFFCGRGASEDGVVEIPLSDLWLSHDRGRLVLRSAKLGREVVPLMGCALLHESDAHTSLLRVLGGLAAQGARGWSWSWPAAVASLPRLPRVTHGRLVLSRATWRLDPALVRRASEHAGGGDRGTLAWLRERFTIPRRVSLLEPGRDLAVDLEDDDDVHMMLARSRAGLTVQLFEQIEDAFPLALEGPRGAHAHEIVVPLVADREEASPGPPRAAEPPSPPGELGEESVPRRFPPGTEWIYATLYLGAGRADEVLTDVVAPRMAELEEAGLVRDWFFLRYNEPDFCLRVRCLASDADAVPGARAVLEEAFGDLVESEVVHRVTFGTYDREIERYGGDEAMLLVERLFAADSRAVVELLPSLVELGPEERWRLAVVGLDDLLGVLGVDADARLALANDAIAALTRTHDIGDDALQTLSRKLRDERAVLDARLAGPPSFLASALRRRAERIRDVSGELRACCRTRPYREVVRSLAHMFMNRISVDNGPAHELAAYAALVRHYEGRRHRTKTT